jgi:3-hydroxybutyrate dehydrogenase
MRERGWGRIINIASTHGLVASRNKAAYVAAKHGLIGLTKVVALETAEENITCNAVCPGWVRTPLVEAQISALAERESISHEEAARKLLAEKQPSLRFTEVEDLGAMAVFLASDNAANMTGAILTADGGWTAQ